MESFQENRLENSYAISFRERNIAGNRIVECIPDSKIHGNPVLIAPGWGESSRVFNRSLKQLAQMNRYGLLVEHNPRISVEKSEDFPSATFRRSEALLSVV